ncbi:MAG: signal peptidase I [bacterium]
MNKEDKLTYKNIWKFVKETLEVVIIALVLATLIRNFLIEPRWIPSGSMRPTLVEKDRIIIEKVSGYISHPKRGDVIVFYPPQEELNQSAWGKFTRLIGYFNSDIAYIKRIIGVPGDTIEVKKDIGVFINGELLNEPYKKEVSHIFCTPNMYCGPIIVPKDSYFMMGDNRNNSQDSRFWGFLPKNRIIGKAVFRFWPINRIGLIEHPIFSK